MDTDAFEFVRDVEWRGLEPYWDNDPEYPKEFILCEKDDIYGRLLKLVVRHKGRELSGWDMVYVFDDGSVASRETGDDGVEEWFDYDTVAEFRKRTTLSPIVYLKAPIDPSDSQE